MILVSHAFQRDCPFSYTSLGLSKPNAQQLTARHDPHCAPRQRLADTWQKQRPSVRKAANTLKFSSFPHATEWHSRDSRGRRQVAVSCSSKQELISDPPRRAASEKLPAPELDCVASGITVECVIPEEPISNGASTAESSEGALYSGGRPSALVESQFKETNTNRLLSRKQENPKTLETLDNTPSQGNGGLVSQEGSTSEALELLSQLGAVLLLISPFFFWGSSMVAMKDVLPRAGPMFVASFRLIPAGLLLVAFAAWKGRPMPSTAMAWVSIAAFAAVDAACFQGFLAEGLKRTSAGLGSVIIDSQPLTVAVLAAILFGEYLGPRGVAGLALGIVGLCLLEVPSDSLASPLNLLPFLASAPDLDTLGALAPPLADSAAAAISTAAATVPDAAPGEWNLLESGEWWMLLAAQSMALGTVMVRWVCKHSDPIMATGWHLVIGGIPLVALSALQQDPALQPGGLAALTGLDWTLLGYTSVFGSAASYGVFFYNASRGNLTKLSSLTFLTPAFAALFGYLFLNETLNGQQVFGASVTLLAIYLVNTQQPPEKEV